MQRKNRVFLKIKCCLALHLGLILATLLTSCSFDRLVDFSGDSERSKDIVQIGEAYAEGFMGFYELGNEYTNQGLQIQADYAYSFAAASVSSMRYFVDCLLYLRGEGETLEEVVGERMSDWDEIAAMNYASPYPWFFEGLTYHVQGKEEAAQVCYEKALVNPAFDSEYGESLMALGAIKKEDLITLKEKLIGYEEEIFASYTQGLTAYPRVDLGFDDTYLRQLAYETLEKNSGNYIGALRHFEAALAVNPYEGDNFVGCALMSLYLGEVDKSFYYINEGLFVDPEHEGLKEIADLYNEKGGAQDD